jgi:hypothetical protein
MEGQNIKLNIAPKYKIEFRLFKSGLIGGFVGMTLSLTISEIIIKSIK